MKFSKSIIAGLLIIGFGLLLSGISFADKGNKEAFTKLLNDSSAALQASRPDLATELTKWSNEEANKKEEKGEKKKLEGKAERDIHAANREAHIKLLRDSATALQASNPTLAADLTKMADKKAKRMTEKKEAKKRP